MEVEFKVFVAGVHQRANLYLIFREKGEDWGICLVFIKCPSGSKIGIFWSQLGRFFEPIAKWRFSFQIKLLPVIFEVWAQVSLDVD